MAGPLATIPDLEVRLGSTLSGTDLARAQANLADVSVLVRSAAGKDWSLADVPEVAGLVVIQATLRAYRNPDGFAGENIGGAYSYTYGPNAQAGLYLTAEEKAIVEAAAGVTGSGRGGFTGSIRTPSAFTPEGVPVLVIPDEIGAAFSEPDRTDSAILYGEGDLL